MRRRAAPWQRGLVTRTQPADASVRQPPEIPQAQQDLSREDWHRWMRFDHRKRPLVAWIAASLTCLVAVVTLSVLTLSWLLLLPRVP